ncbi:N-acetylmuramoyl-L-alanine amidase [Luteimonas sp. SDU101]|uniref:N-acetylmuramoyl-L-alanine amidase n=1 Tax=unclassified Luteimonas TaxID=2629088 RepID=UPI003EBDB43B
MPLSPAGPGIERQHLPYVERLEARAVAVVELVVIHCTELPDLATAREYGERALYDSGTGNSGHWYIDRGGRIVEYVPPTRIAHHVRGRNAESVGIELVNRGRWPRWLDAGHQAMDEPYPDAQIEALLALLAQLRATLPALARIAGHEDLDTARVPASDDPSVLVPRKRDPGPLFPWPRVLESCGLRRIP